MDPIKKSGWTHRTATDAVVRYQTVKVPARDAVAPTEFSTNRRLRTHIPVITHPTLYSTDAPFTMLGMGCPHHSFHNSYPVAAHDIPNPPIVTEEGFAAVGYRQYDRIIPEESVGQTGGARHGGTQPVDARGGEPPGPRGRWGALSDDGLQRPPLAPGRPLAGSSGPAGVLPPTAAGT